MKGTAMREDMAKVIVENPRWDDGSWRKGRRVPDELLPARLGLRRQAREHGGYKMLNENLPPLRRYLERQVGRPWAKVYSDICAHLRATSTVQQHVRDHIEDFVQLHDTPAPYRRPDLYVDPRDGLLKRRRPIRRPARAAPPLERIALSPTAELRRICGVWYEVALAPLPAPEYRASPVGRRLVTPAVRDAVAAGPVLAGPEFDRPTDWRIFRAANPNRTYAVAKRQLSRRELRSHGLTNMAG
jgi:hypothetical protein